MTDLNLGIIGNNALSMMIDRTGRYVWGCVPRFDGDPIFCHLINDGETGEDPAPGTFEIKLDRLERTEQHYMTNTAVLVTRLFDEAGGAIEIVDFAPRFEQFGRMFRPMMVVRIVRPIAGTPRVRIRLKPMWNWGATPSATTHGSNHIRYVGPDLTLRLTTNAPISYMLDDSAFLLEEPVALMLGPDETLRDSPGQAAHEFLARTTEYWRDWVRGLALPLEYQDAVIRAAITTNLCSYEETGAIIAAMTTSIPEMPNSGRNWDYRYCWPRDAFFVVRALNRLGAVPILENYLRYLSNIVASAEDGFIQPVYGIALESKLTERTVDSLKGYRGMGPVRVGNQAYEQIQHDVYGDIILASTQAFFDQRLLRPAGLADFRRLEEVGGQALRMHDQPDASMWERRSDEQVYTSSSLMCWAACDRLGKIAEHLALPERAHYWHGAADKVKKVIEARAWNEELGSFVDAFEGDEIDASLLLMAEVGFVEPQDPRFLGTMNLIEKRLLRDNHLMRYAKEDDFGAPENSFIICTFWYIETLAALGRRDEALAMFEDLLAKRNHLGLLSEDLDVKSGELWGNYPQTFSLVGLINCAIRLSPRWETVL